MPKSGSTSKKKAARKAGAGGKTARESRSSRTKAAAPTVFTNYPAAVKFLYDRVNVERTRPQRIDPAMFKLERMERLMSALGNPESSLRTVHVAGTNGKGSVVAMLSACLRKSGYTVGTYTSPHLVDLRERIMINDHMIPHAQMTELAGRVADAAEAIPKKLGVPTFFEVITAIGLLYFSEQAVDVAIIETGMGGRLDATNILTPEVAAVTGIALDHTQFLGGTIGAIAREKSGIFKKGVPALTFKQENEALEAMASAAEAAGAAFEVVGKDIEFSYRFEASPQLGPHTRVGLSTERVVYEHVPVPLAGEHQAMNCGLVLAILDKLIERGFELSDADVIRGLSETKLPGRMEMVWREPRILLDGAHNPTAVQALIRSIGAHVPYDSLVVIFGCSADKDVDELLGKVALGADKVIFTKSRGNPRAADPHDLQRRFHEMSAKMSQVAETLDVALSIAVRAASREDLVCITGSFYLVGEAKKALADRLSKAQQAASVSTG